ncbi:hypothetical protein Metbo_1986 [Methanobacterium lacus]|uniref:Uncharacterized protein n=1 Tax=Methanobacterium lacus (strain AL-21) TaxID=877455 RepID=F0TBD7_METLA|nr:hypothetical protein [Methanobacterium lacus]ADZ10206.1 hypothetical protein Metbo_1986 [Methanobacterium lacus]
MPKRKPRLIILKQEISKFDNWFKRVLLREKSAIYAHKKNELNYKFDQYHRFLDALESYDMITVQDFNQSLNEINQKRIKEEEDLAKTIWQD